MASPWTDEPQSSQPMQAHQLELLAPARNLEIGIETIHHGADAVYIGGPSFSAQSTADNSIQDIAKLVQNAHEACNACHVP